MNCESMKMQSKGYFLDFNNCILNKFLVLIKHWKLIQIFQSAWNNKGFALNNLGKSEKAIEW